MNAKGVPRAAGCIYGSRRAGDAWVLVATGLFNAELAEAQRSLSRKSNALRAKRCSLLLGGLWDSARSALNWLIDAAADLRIAHSVAQSCGDAIDGTSRVVGASTHRGWMVGSSPTMTTLGDGGE